MSEKSASLYYKDGSSDKIYVAKIEPKDKGYVVNFQYGRRGSTLTAGTKTTSPVSLEEATKVFDKLIKEKIAKGYSPGEEGTPFQGTDKAGEVSGMVPQLLNSIDQQRMEELLLDDDWFAQEKMDGKHLMVRRNEDGTVIGSNRKGLIVPLPTSIESGIKELIFTFGELDGESIGDIYHVFDLLGLGGNNFRNAGALARSVQLAEMVQFKKPKNVVFVRSAVGTEKKIQLFNDIKSLRGEGIVFKKKDSLYVPGRPNSGGNMLKFKFTSSATLVVLATNKGKRSIQLAACCPEGFQFVGNVTIPNNFDIPLPNTLVEIRYLYFFKGGSLFQPVYLGAREDKDVADELDSLKVKQEVEDNV